MTNDDIKWTVQLVVTAVVPLIAAYIMRPPRTQGTEKEKPPKRRNRSKRKR